MAERLAQAFFADPAQAFTDGVFRLYLALDQSEAAFAFLERDKRKFVRLSGVFYLDPIYDGVREDPRFLRKLEEAGFLAEYREAWAYLIAWQKKTGRR